MRTFDSSSAASATVGPLDIARWEQYGLGEKLPFGAMWYTVPAGRSSLRDCHPELELSLVLNGTAFVECGGRITEVPTGSAILFDSEEPHIVHNRSHDVPLNIFSAYWMPVETTASGDVETKPAPEAAPVDSSPADGHSTEPGSESIHA
jgi:quercetin dioxygenase-like cupin family protein